MANKTSVCTLKVLLVEDNPFHQRVTTILLNRLRHQVTVANNGRSALETLQKHDFDLVLMDIQMPEMNGLEATQLIRDRNSSVRNPEIPVIAVTAMAGSDIEHQFKQAGLDGHLRKPVNQKKLEEVLSTLFSSRITHPAEKKKLTGY